MILDLILTIAGIVLFGGIILLLISGILILAKVIIVGTMDGRQQRRDRDAWEKKVEDAEMNKFQIGDTVVSEIDRYDGGLTKGKCYCVVAKHYDEISVIFDNGVTGTARYSNFKLYQGPNLDKVEEYYEILQAQELMQDAQEGPPRQDTTEVLS